MGIQFKLCFYQLLITNKIILKPTYLKSGRFLVGHYNTSLHLKNSMKNHFSSNKLSDTSTKIIFKNIDTTQQYCFLKLH